MELNGRERERDAVDFHFYYVALLNLTYVTPLIKDKTQFVLIFTIYTNKRPCC